MRRRSQLKSKPRPRRETFAARDFNGSERRCELALHDPKRRPCRGPMQRAHLVPQTFLRSLGLLQEEIWEPFMFIWACELHHGELDGGGIPKRRSMIRNSLDRFAEDQPRLAARLRDDYGPRSRIFDRRAA